MMKLIHQKIQVETLNLMSLSLKDDRPTIKDFSFSEQIGLKIDVPVNASPIFFFFFQLLLTDKFVDDLVTKTNEYATKLINHNQPMRCKSLSNLWKNVNFDENFIGLFFSMGLISFFSCKKYWSNDLLYKNEYFSSTLSRERFESIIRFFNFGKEPMFCLTMTS